MSKLSLAEQYARAVRENPNVFDGMAKTGTKPLDLKMPSREELQLPRNLRPSRTLADRIARWLNIG